MKQELSAFERGMIRRRGWTEPLTEEQQNEMKLAGEDWKQFKTKFREAVRNNDTEAMRKLDELLASMETRTYEQASPPLQQMAKKIPKLNLNIPKSVPRLSPTPVNEDVKPSKTNRVDDWGQSLKNGKRFS